MSWIIRLVFTIAVLSVAVAPKTNAQTIPHATEVERLIAETERAARTNQLSAERVLYAADQAIDAAAVIVSSINNKRLIHTELKRLADGVPGARAIIVIAQDGRLKHDSYKYPTFDINLSDRAYFKEALTRTDMVIGQKEVGRTSGAAFVPLAKRLGNLTFVVVAAPFALVDLQSECADCWSLALQSDAKIVTMFPPEVKVAPEVLELAVDAKTKSGVQVARYRNSVVGVAWRKSEDFELVSVSIRGLPDTASVDVDIN